MHSDNNNFHYHHSPDQARADSAAALCLKKKMLGVRSIVARLPSSGMVLPLSKAAPSSRRFLEVKVNGDTAQVEITPVKGYKCDPPGTWVDTTKQEVLKALRDMMLMRRMEIAADLMYKSQLIKGFCHLYDGQVTDRKFARFSYVCYTTYSFVSIPLITQSLYLSTFVFNCRKPLPSGWRWAVPRKTQS